MTTPASQNPIMVDSSFQETLTHYRQRVDNALLTHLPALESSGTQLPTVMHYAVTNGGKRVRPVLTYATGKALNLSLDRVDVAACALEMGCEAVLVNSAIAAAENPEAMGAAFKAGVEAGRDAHRAGLMPTSEVAVASSPLTSFLSTDD